MDLKLSYFCQKNYLKLSSFSEKRNQLPDPQPPAAGGFTSKPSKQSPLIANSWLPDPAPRGGKPRPCPPNWLLEPPKQKLCPPKRGLCPEEINRLMTSGAQIEVQISFFVDWHQILWRFWDEDLFFYFGEHVFLAGKTAWNLISAGKPLAISVKTFFFLFGDHLNSAGKTAWISNIGRKIPLTFCSSPCLFDPDWDKFLVPPCPSRIHINKLLVPIQNLFLPPPPPPPPPPPVTLSWRWACWLRANFEWLGSSRIHWKPRDSSYSIDLWWSGSKFSRICINSR